MYCDLTVTFVQEICGGCDHLEPRVVRTHPLRRGSGHPHAPHVPAGALPTLCCFVLFCTVLRYIDSSNVFAAVDAHEGLPSSTLVSQLPAGLECRELLVLSGVLNAIYTVDVS